MLMGGFFLMFINKVGDICLMQYNHRLKKELHSLITTSRDFLTNYADAILIKFILYNLNFCSTKLLSKSFKIPYSTKL